jgi:lipoprotein NlpD
MAFEKDRSLQATLLALVGATLVGACTTSVPAPVVDRTVRRDPPPPIQRVPQPLPPSREGAPLIIQPDNSGVTTMPAPATVIGERSAPPAITGSPISGTQPGNTPGSAFHVVQRGETLYRIAVNNGLNVDALASWNNIAAGQGIREGQVLRLRPPEGTITSVTPIAGQPLPGDGRSAPPATMDAPLKTEPRAQRVPYSDSALAQIQRSEGNVVPPAVTQPSSPASAPSVGATDPTRSAPPAGATLQPLAGEAEFKPGNGVDRDGVAWTWPTTGKLASRFNERAAMKGVDIATRIGTPVVAAAAGKVIYVGKEPRGFGQMIVVSHAKETVSVYFHTDKVLVKEQQRVTLGQRIAEVAESAESKMHFEVRRQGRPLDPVSLMPSR